MKWTKCSDKLPPHDKPFLGFGLDALQEGHETLAMIYWKGGLDDDGYSMQKGYYALGRWGEYVREHDCNVTHWMPLPIPPND